MTCAQARLLAQLRAARLPAGLPPPCVRPRNGCRARQTSDWPPARLCPPAVLCLMFNQGLWTVQLITGLRWLPRESHRTCNLTFLKKENYVFPGLKKNARAMCRTTRRGFKRTSFR